MTVNRGLGRLQGLGAGTFLDMTSDPNLQCGLFQLGILRPECWAASVTSPVNSGASVPIEAWIGIGMLAASLFMLKR